MTQILNPGVAPADDDGVGRGHSGGEPVPAAHAALPVLAPRASSRSGPATGLTINATFDSTITSDPNAAAMEATINTAIANIQSIFSDPITVTINFSKMNGGLGQSSSYYGNISYSTFVAALKADATTTDDATATALLPSVSTNPVNGSSTINVKTANLRAVGIAANPPAGQPDGSIGLNTSITSPGSPGTTGLYNLLPVVEHEIDEVLGLGSALPSLSFNTIFPEDLYRYDQSGVRTLTTTSTVNAFFSINGSTDLAQFDNQNDGGDFGDWQSNPRPSGVLPKVQDAFVTPGANPALSVELTALDVIGYNRNSPPPATTLLSPIGKLSTNAPTFTWNATNSASSYYLSVQNSSGTAVIQQWYASAVCGPSTCSVTPAGALSRGTYRWWVDTWNSSGYGPQSSSLTFFLGLTSRGDFDGDDKADITVFRPSNGTWYTRYSGTGTIAGFQWGNGSDVPVPGDYDGDGKTDIAVFRPSDGTWYIVYSSTGNAAGFQWGNGNDVPVPGDYNGDGKTDVAVFRPSDGTWYIWYSGTATTVGVQWGNGNDVPVPRDYDGDGKTDVAVFRPSNGTWYIVYSSTGTSAGVQWGNGNDRPEPGDYDGDGKTDIAVFRPSNGTWYVVYSSTGTAIGVQWGNANDVPVPGDYDGDGKTDIAVFRPSNGTWYVIYSSTGTAVGVQWGNGADIPIP
jgi:VCBS repeat protein